MNEALPVGQSRTLLTALQRIQALYGIKGVAVPSCELYLETIAIQLEGGGIIREIGKIRECENFTGPVAWTQLVARRSHLFLLCLTPLALYRPHRTALLQRTKITCYKKMLLSFALIAFPNIPHSDRF